MSTEIRVRGVEGLPEVREGDDLAALIADAVHTFDPPLADGDVLVVTSKIISKAEGRSLRTERDEAIDAETVRVVARAGKTRIVQTRQGLVMAAAGVDAASAGSGPMSGTRSAAATSTVCVGSNGRSGSSGRSKPRSGAVPVVPPTITSSPPAPSHRRSASAWASVSCAASMSCQTRRSIAAHASTRGGRSAAVRVMTVGAATFGLSSAVLICGSSPWGRSATTATMGL